MRLSSTRNLHEWKARGVKSKVLCSTFRSMTVCSVTKSRQELVQEIRQQQASNETFRKICEEILSRTVYDCTGQKIKGIKASEDSTAVAGFINTSGEELKIEQDICVTADKRSFAGADVIKNMNFKDLHSSPAADHTGYRGWEVSNLLRWSNPTFSSGVRLSLSHALVTSLFRVWPVREHQNINNRSHQSLRGAPLQWAAGVRLMMQILFNLLNISFQRTRRKNTPFEPLNRLNLRF